MPASGKSSSIVNPLSQYYHSAVIDSDIIKRKLPEFTDGWGGSLVHEESSQINMDLLEESMKLGNNIVLPIVGSKVSSVERYIELAKIRGYNINVHLNELSGAKATGRALSRYFSDGRFIDPAYVSSLGNKPTEVYEQIKQRSDINGYSRWNNDVPRGQRPELAEISETNKLYASYSATWGSGSRQVSGRLAQSSEQAASTNNQITPIDKASSKDGVFFDGKITKYSLSAEGERPRSTGRYGVRGEDVKLQTAPIKEKSQLLYILFKAKKPFKFVCAHISATTHRNGEFCKQNVAFKQNRNAFLRWILNPGFASANITGESPEGANFKIKNRSSLWCTFRDSNPGPTD